MGPQVRRFLITTVISLAVLPSAVLTWQFRDMPHLGSSHDDGLYWVSARALAQQREYRISSLPGEPWETKYPPLYSVWLAPAWLVSDAFPSNLPVAALLSWVWFPLFAAGAWRFYRSSGFGEWQSLVLTALTAVLPQSVFTANLLMSDIMFAALLVWSLNFARTRPLIAGLLAGLAYLTRSAALPLLVAVPVYYVITKQRTAALKFLGSALPFAIAWHVWCEKRFLPGTDEVTLYYTNYFRYQLASVPFDDPGAHVLRNGTQLVKTIAGLLAIDAGSIPPMSFLQAIVAAACISGVIRMVRRGFGVPFAAFALLYVALLIVWLFIPHPRFLLPILPVLLAGVWVEAGHLVTMLRQSWRTAPVAAVLIASALSATAVLAGWNIVDEYRLSLKVLAAERGKQDQLAGAYAWVRSNTSAQAVFYAVNDPVFYLKTGRHALRRAVLSDVYASGASGLRPTTGFLQFLQRHGVTHVLLSSNDFEPAVPSLRIDVANTNLRPVYRDASAVVLEVER